MLLRVTVEVEGQAHNIDYESLDECLNDAGLRAMFEDKLVSTCSIHTANKRVAGLPPALMSWDRFRDTIISNSSSILREKAP